MNAERFFDTNVLVYAVSTDAVRAPIASGVLAGGGVVSAQVLNEFAAVSRRKLRRSWQEVADALSVFRSLCPKPVPITVETHEAALRIAMRDGTTFFDALILAAALDAGCTELLSEDMQHGQVIEGRLTVRNPFH